MNAPDADAPFAVPSFGEYCRCKALPQNRAAALAFARWLLANVRGGEAAETGAED